MISCWFEIGLAVYYSPETQTRNFTLRPLRLFRVFHAIYSALGLSVMDTFYSNFRELRVYLFAAVLIMACAILATASVHMHMFGTDFSLRCVHQATGGPMLPETWCPSGTVSRPPQPPMPPSCVYIPHRVSISPIVCLYPPLCHPPLLPISLKQLLCMHPTFLSKY